MGGHRIGQVSLYFSSDALWVMLDKFVYIGGPRYSSHLTFYLFIYSFV